MSDRKSAGKPEERGKRGRPRGKGTQMVYEALRDEILMLSLRPGEHIDESRIEERFKVSRTPIREALIRLQANGLMRFSPNRGHYVSTLEFSELPRAFESLDLLQAAILKLAAQRRTDDDLDRMEQENEYYLTAASARDHIAMTEANHRFHLVCGQASRNRFLSDAYETVLNYNLRLTRLVFATNGHAAEETQAYFERIYGEHAEMIALIRARDEEPLAVLSRQHVFLFQSKIVEFVQSSAMMGADIADYDSTLQGKCQMRSA